MHDIKAIRENPTAFDAALLRRGLQPLSGKLIELDEARRANITALQEAQARRNTVSKEIGKAKASKDDALAAKLMAEVADLKTLLEQGEAKQRENDAELQHMLEIIPNLPRPDVPDGRDEHGNVEVRKIGTLPAFSFKPKQHFELGEALGLMDFEAAAKVSGARFVFLKGALARMERALAAFMLDLHTAPATANLGGYTEVNPPLLVRADSAHGTGNLPKFADDLFHTFLRPDFDKFRELVTVAIDKMAHLDLADHPGLEYEPEAARQTLATSIADIQLRKRATWVEALQEYQKLAGQLFLIPTAEVSLTNLVRDEILDEEKLPLRFTAATPCFRSEAGSAGRDTRGMIRQHQFTKVELVTITTPEESTAEHERMVACAEEVLKRLKLPFRTMLLCTGDMGFASQKTYDIEVWLPGQDTYREISSCSVCGDFQARRMNARSRAKAAKDTRFVHTLNGSGLAVGRTLVAILENYQQADGSIVIPDVLRPYMGGTEVIGARV